MARSIQTVEVAEIALSNARKALAAGAASTLDTAPDAGRLAGMLNAVAACEGALRVAHVAASSRSREAVQEYLMDQVLQGADDTWSGRTNDVQRAKFDGFRKSASRVLDSYRYGD